MNGGYVLVDCTGLDLIKGSTQQTIPGIRDRVINAMKTNKPIMAVNANWDGAFVSPIFVFAIEIGTDIICTASTLQIVIAKNGKVTINNMAPQN